MGKTESLHALEQGRMPERYARNSGTVGVAGQLRLLQGRVAVVGAGGLGGHAIELLARLGVGYVRLIDGDQFMPHNLNRQLLATEETLGKNKAMTGKARIELINGDVECEAIAEMLREDNATRLLAGVDVVLDGLDNHFSRVVAVQAARQLQIPFIHGAIAGFVGQVAVFMPDTDDWKKVLQGCGDQPVSGIEQTLGNPATTPAIAAALQVQEAVKLLTGIGQPLAGRLLYFDLAASEFDVLYL